MMNDGFAADEPLSRERQDVEAIEADEPLRRRLLIALGKREQTPTQLAASVGARKESVSRKLAELRAEGLVAAIKNQDDRRTSHYSLTRGGQSEVGRHLAFGATEDIPGPPAREEIDGLLREALAGAIEIRRKSNRLSDAADRLGEIRTQAEEVESQDIALEAIAELAITQRQGRHPRKRKQTLALLEKMALGSLPVEPELVLPAIALLEYERGRGGDLGPGNAEVQASHLCAAISLFTQLGEHSTRSDRAWQTRRARAVVGLAENLRAQARYEESLRYAASGLQLFEDLDNDYGRTKCWLLFGFGLRLLRRFDASWACLGRAQAIAAKSGYEREVCNCLLQMADVKRCQGDTSQAGEILAEALSRTGQFDLRLSHAIATSALGAVQFQKEEFDVALRTLESAQRVLVSCHHTEGLALNARRQATVARHLGAGEGPPVREVARLIALARLNYEEMGSPAGLAACEIESGWLRKRAPSLGKVGVVVKNLRGLLNDGRQREAIELDAWLPAMLMTFGHAVPALRKEADRIHSISERQLEEKGVQGVESVREATRGLGDLSDGGDTAPLALEMGGESRRRQAPLALPAG